MDVQNSKVVSRNAFQHLMEEVLATSFKKATNIKTLTT